MNRDPGLQPERTALAWSRTALAMTVNALLVLRAGMQAGDAVLLALGVGVGAFALGVLAAGMLRRRQLAGVVFAAPAPLMFFTAASTMLAAVAGLCTLWP